ncbi:MAG: CoB--CoM heterodisulfide reductase iron-sulfur subunit A family protein [Deltaproteobacteria bacterium]|nr:CoB--CoM heterodisulfide reductase iron-sulfur subunit A family protein [Deltaproteobacteria bacterium]
MSSHHSSVLVVGGGMAGITAAVESAELGREVYLVEKTPSLGGRVAGMKHYFPKLCPPYCGLEINYRRIKENPKITVLTSSEVEKIEGNSGDYNVTVKVGPRFIKEDVLDPVTPFANLEATIPNSFNYNLDKKRAVGVPHEQAFPYSPVVDQAALDDPEIRSQVENLPGVDLSQEPKEMNLKVGSIIWTTGWVPYDASKIEYLNYDKYPDVITNVEMERLAAVNGPTAGKLVRLSDGREAKRVAFIQCAGSRDDNHLPYCSAVCCMASLKQSTYVREAFEDSEVWIFYIDIRANKYESFYRKIQDDEKVHFIKGKAGSVELDQASGDLVVTGEDVDTDSIAKVQVDLVVLATGMVPETRDHKVPYDGLTYDEFGFLVADPEKAAIYPAGCVKRPVDVATTVQDATGTSCKAIRN